MMRNNKSKILAKFFLLFLLIFSLTAMGLRCGNYGASYINFHAELDGEPWGGSLNYSLTGPLDTEEGLKAWQEGRRTLMHIFWGSKTRTFDGVSWMVTSKIPAYQIITYNSGGPQGALFRGIRLEWRPESNETQDPMRVGPIRPLDTLTPYINCRDMLELYEDVGGYEYHFYFIFESTNEITVNATLDGDPWEGPVSYTIEGPETKTGDAVAQTFGELSIGTYTVTYNSGGPPDAVLTSISPSTTELTRDEAATITLEFESEEMTGEITVNATLDGDPWEGEVSYTIEGPEAESGSTVPQSFTMPVGTYTVTDISGGPEGAVLSGVSPSATDLSTGETATLTLEFVTTGEITVNAILQGIPWSGEVSYTIQGPQTESGASVPRSFSGLPAGTYTVTYNSGGPKYAIFSHVNPSNPGELSAGETTTFILVFIYPATDVTAPPPAAVPTADLSLTKDVDYDMREQEQDIAYTITVTNDGPDAATNIVVTDILPAGVNFVFANPSQGAYNNVTGIWTVGTIVNGGNENLLIVVTVTGNPGTVITNTAEVTSVDQGDPDSTPGNDAPGEDDQDNAVTTVLGGTS